MPLNPLSQHLVLAFVPKYNSDGKKDATGAFHPEATAFKALAQPGSTIYQFDNSKPMATRRKEILNVLDGYTDDSVRQPTTVAFFCHGWADGIQAGFTRKTAGELAWAISLATENFDGVVPLYCCSTGDDPQDVRSEAAGTGDNSFADKLRDALCAEGENYCRIVAHTTAAHTTKNPMVLFMDGMGSSSGGVGGYMPVSPQSAHWAAWKKALQKTDLRFRMPYMTPAEIHAELSK
jgi:hypothetical protein